MPPQSTPNPSWHNVRTGGDEDIDAEVELIQTTELFSDKLRRRIRLRRWRKLILALCAVAVASVAVAIIQAGLKGTVRKGSGGSSPSSRNAVDIDIEALIEERTQHLESSLDGDDGEQGEQAPAAAYRSPALRWLLDIDRTSLNSKDAAEFNAEEQILQLYALACLYFSTNGQKNDWTDFKFGAGQAVPGWRRSDGWLTTRDARDVCFSWYGVRCDQHGRVQYLQLDSNGLAGYLPAEMAFLAPSLLTLELHDNYLRNQEPSGLDFLAELTNLRRLFYGSNPLQFYGVPTIIGRLTKLEEYDCSDTLHYGPLDNVDWAQLSNLRYLSMERNNYFGADLPSAIIHLPNLTHLYAERSQLTVHQGGDSDGFSNGHLDFIKHMPKIRELWLDHNHGFGGWLPDSFGDTLVSFSCSNCTLYGPLSRSTQWADSPQLQKLWLHDNALTGTISSSFGAALTDLTRLHLQSNQLTGAVPEEVCALANVATGDGSKLQHLEADCHEGDKIDCDCCTCCGEVCTSRMMDTSV